jgi:hypothetical protein
MWPFLTQAQRVWNPSHLVLAASSVLEVSVEMMLHQLLILLLWTMMPLAKPCPPSWATTHLRHTRHQLEV